MVTLNRALQTRTHEFFNLILFLDKRSRKHNAVAAAAHMAELVQGRHNQTINTRLPTFLGTVTSKKAL